MAGNTGSGKSTLARHLAKRVGAAVLDYDVVKSAALDAGATWELSAYIGHNTIRAIGESLLIQGTSVIIDSPCRFQQNIDEGTAIAERHGAVYAYIECILDDVEERRRRILTRSRYRSQVRDIDIPAPDAPFARFPQLNYDSQHPPTPWLRIDTSQSLETCLSLAQIYLQERCQAT